MIFLRVLLLAMLLTIVAGCSTVKGWFGGKGKENVHPPAELTQYTPSVSVQKLWSRSIGHGEKLLGLRQQPFVADGRVYAASSYGGAVYAIDAATGRDIWRADTKLRLSGGPGAGSGTVVVGSINGDVVALAADTGAERWRTQVSSEILSTPLIAGDVVIVRCGDGHVYGFNLADGNKRWTFEHALPSLSLRGNPSPVLGANGIVYLGYEDGSMVALRAQDGSKAWEQVVAQPEGRSEIERLADIDGNVIADPDAVYAISYKGQLLAMSPSSGAPGWNREVGSYGGLARSGNNLYASDALGTVWAFDRGTGNPLWKQAALGYRWLSSPAVQGEYVVVGDLQGYLHWLRADTGELAARVRIGKGAIRATPQVSADGVLYAVNTDDQLAAYRIGK
jgi:outer membrane protein assembly factor BamB